jgi:hypothetical protein
MHVDITCTVLEQLNVFISQRDPLNFRAGKRSTVVMLNCRSFYGDLSHLILPDHPSFGPSLQIAFSDLSIRECVLQGSHTKEITILLLLSLSQLLPSSTSLGETAKARHLHTYLLHETLTRCHAPRAHTSQPLSMIAVTGRYEPKKKIYKLGL